MAETLKTKKTGSMELTTTENKPAPPVDITEDIQVSLNRLGRDLETHAESGIRIGKELLFLKETLKAENGYPRGTFGKVVEWAFPTFGSTQRKSYMNVARQYGEKDSQLSFSSQVLIELSRPSVPESAREEAEEHESLTVKQAKEIAEANKRIAALRIECAQLKTPKAPDINNLIPELRKLLKGGSITEARALELSTLPHEKQDVYLQEFHSKEFYRKEAERAKEERAKALQDAMDAVKAKEEAIKQLEENAGVDNTKLIKQHQKEFKELQRYYLEKLHEEKKKAEMEASELHEKLNKEKIAKAYEDKDKAEKAKKQAQEKANAAYSKREELEREIKRLQEQLEVNNPTNVDMAMEKQIRSAANVFMFAMKDLRHEALSIGGGMERSIDAVDIFIVQVSQKLDQLKEDIGSTITITQEGLLQ